MPVLREQFQVGAIRPGGVVRIGAAEAAAQGSAAIGHQFAAIGSDIMRIAQDMHEEEALALARNVTISLDENGVPQMDASVGNRLSILARRSFDRALDERYANRIRMEVAGRMHEAQTRYPDDPAGFSVEASLIAEEMSKTVPEAFVGRFNDFVAAYTLQNGGQVGRAAEARRRQEQKSEFVASVPMVAEEILGVVMAGDQAAGQVLYDEAMRWGQDMVNRGLMLPHELQRARQELNVAMGEASIRREVVQAELAGEDPLPLLDAWERSLRLGDDRARALIADDTERQQVAARISALAGDRRARASQRAREEAEDAEIFKVMNGAAEHSGKNRDRLDVGLGRKFNAGNPVDVEFWLGEAGTLAEVWDAISMAGQLPQSLIEAMNTFQTMGDEGKVRMMQLFRSVSHGKRPDGTPLRMADPLAPLNKGVEMHMMLTDTLMAAGGPGMETMGEAADRALVLMEQMDENEDRVFTAARTWKDSQSATSGTGLFGQLFSGPPVPDWLFQNKDDLQQNLRFYARTAMLADEDRRLWFADGNITDQDAGRVGLLMYHILSSGVETEIDAAYEKAVGWWEQRNPDTEAIYSEAHGSMLSRSWASPEAIYGVAPEIQWKTPGFLEGLWDVMTRPSWWEVEINSQIRDSVVASGAFEGNPPEFLETGTHYGLVPIGTSRQAPDYHVIMFDDDVPYFLRTPAGARVVINLHDPHQKLMADQKERELELMREEERMNERMLQSLGMPSGFR